MSAYSAAQPSTSAAAASSSSKDETKEVLSPPSSKVAEEWDTDLEHVLTDAWKKSVSDIPVQKLLDIFTKTATDMIHKRLPSENALDTRQPLCFFNVFYDDLCRQLLDNPLMKKCIDDLGGKITKFHTIPRGFYITKENQLSFKEYDEFHPPSTVTTHSADPTKAICRDPRVVLRSLFLDVISHYLFHKCVVASNPKEFAEKYKPKTAELKTQLELMLKLLKMDTLSFGFPTTSEVFGPIGFQGQLVCNHTPLTDSDACSADVCRRCHYCSTHNFNNTVPCGKCYISSLTQDTDQENSRQFVCTEDEFEKEMGRQLIAEAITKKRGTKHNDKDDKADTEETEEPPKKKLHTEEEDTEEEGDKKADTCAFVSSTGGACLDPPVDDNDYCLTHQKRCGAIGCYEKPAIGCKCTSARFCVTHCSNQLKCFGYCTQCGEQTKRIANCDSNCGRCDHCCIVTDKLDCMYKELHRPALKAACKKPLVCCGCKCCDAHHKSVKCDK